MVYIEKDKCTWMYRPRLSYMSSCSSPCYRSQEETIPSSPQTHGSSQSAATRCTHGTCGTWPHTQSVPHRAAAHTWCLGSTAHRRTLGAPGICDKQHCQPQIPLAQVHPQQHDPPTPISTLLHVTSPVQALPIFVSLLQPIGSLQPDPSPPMLAQGHVQSGGRR